MAEKAAAKAMDLFEAYQQNKLPKDRAYVLSSFINGNTGYAIYEIVSYADVKAIYPEGTGLTFQSSGKKMYVLLEPASYPKKATEPYLREKGYQIPLRFKELILHTAKNQTKIYIAKKPSEALSSFTVAKPEGFNVSFVFFNAPEIYESLTKFFEKTYNNDARIPQADAKKAAIETVNIVKEIMSFKGDYGS
jgi:hypothetical protein